MKFYIADPHFSHPNVIGFCKRPFKNISEMNETLIQNWRDKVGSEDEVYVIGDFFFKSQNPPEYFLDQLPGRLNLILGNHDHRWLKGERLPRYFHHISEFFHFKDDGKRLTLCHYPMMTWPGSGRLDSFMIYGHIHNGTELPFWPVIMVLDNALNAGADLNGFAPVTFEELRVNNALFKERWYTTASVRERMLIDHLRVYAEAIPRQKW